MTKISILGTEYTVTEDSKIDDSCDGLTDVYAKSIKLRPADDLFSSEKAEDDNAKLIRREEILLHEICHAFFFESGLADYCYDETLIGWLGKQLPKISVVYNALVEEAI